MKFLIIFILLVSISTKINSQIDSNKGHPEHFIAGFVIGGVTSYLVFKKTDNKFKAWLIGTGAAMAAGFLKEAIDPMINKERSFEDFKYTAVGGIIGASIVIPLRKKNPHKTAYLY